MAGIATFLSPSPVICEDCSVECERTSNRQRTCVPCRKRRAVEREKSRKLADPEKYLAQQAACRDRIREKRRKDNKSRYHRRKVEDYENLRKEGLKNGRAFRARVRQKKLDAGWSPRVPMAPQVKTEVVRERARQRYRANPLRWRMAAAIRRALQGQKQKTPWAELVGYSADDLRGHIERQFLKGMTWDNMSEWHIDHIIPLSAFVYTSPFDPDFRAAWAMTNLRPLWATANMQKSNKRQFLL